MKSAKAYTDYFPIIPFSLLQKSIPNQESLKVLVENLVTDKVLNKGSMSYIKLMTVYLPHFYIPQAIVPYDQKNDGFGTNASFIYQTQLILSRQDTWIENYAAYCYRRQVAIKISSKA